MFSPLTDIHNAQHGPLAMPPEPLVIGFIFRQSDNRYYDRLGAGSVKNRRDAWLFEARDIKGAMLAGPRQKRKLGIGTYWGRKEAGHWIAVYARLPTMNCHS